MIDSIIITKNGLTLLDPEDDDDGEDGDNGQYGDDFVQ